METSKTSISVSGRKHRDLLAWVVVLFGLFPLTLWLAWQLTNEKTLRDEANYQAKLWLVIVDQSQSAAIVTSANTGEIISWTAGAEELLGWTAEEVRGTSMLFLMPEDYRKTHLRIIQDPQVRKKLLNDVLRLTVRINTKSGGSELCAITVRGVEDKQNARYRFILTFNRVEQLILPVPLAPVALNDFKVPEAVQDRNTTALRTSYSEDS